MNKAELITSMAEKSQLTKKDAESALKAFIDSVQEALENGDKVQLIGFGTFETRERAAREGRNPRTKETITIPASTVPVFKINIIKKYLEEEKMRLDKYLKVSRIIKRRTVAKEACENGRVAINDKVAKPSTDVKEGDIIEITFATRKLKAKIVNIAEHVRKEEAKEMYIIIEGEEDKE